MILEPYFVIEIEFKLFRYINSLAGHIFRAIPTLTPFPELIKACHNLFVESETLLASVERTFCSKALQHCCFKSLNKKTK